MEQMALSKFVKTMCKEHNIIQAKIKTIVSTYDIIHDSLLHLRHTLSKTRGWSAESVFLSREGDFATSRRKFCGIAMKQ